MAEIQYREHVLVNTDPQRRCYNGCHFKSEVVWSSWTTVDTCKKGVADGHLAFWKDLNRYDVSQRGSSVHREFRVID